MKTTVKQTLLKVNFEGSKTEIIIELNKKDIPEAKKIVKAHFKNYEKTSPIFNRVNGGGSTHEFNINDEGFGELVSLK